KAGPKRCFSSPRMGQSAGGCASSGYAGQRVSGSRMPPLRTWPSITPLPQARKIAGAPLGEAAPAGPAVSAAVITRNRAELLARTLPTVLAQDVPPGGFEVIVVDDGSSDGTPRFLAEQSAGPELRVLRQAPRGVSAARNAALE